MKEGGNIECKYKRIMRMREKEEKGKSGKKMKGWTRKEKRRKRIVKGKIGKNERKKKE